MRNHTQSLDGQLENTPAATGLLGPKAARLLNCGQAIRLSAGATLTVIGLVLIAVLGWINLQAVRGLRFEFVYLLVCALVGWAAGLRGALTCTLASGICLYFADTAGTDLSRQGWALAANSLVRLLAFAAMGWLAAEAGRLTCELRRAVEQRTARLASEVEEHEETVELLRDTVQLFHQVTGSITDVFWVTSPAKGVLDYVSPAFETLWGESCKTLYAAPEKWLDAIHVQDRERVADAKRAQITGDYDEEYRVVRPDGSLRWVHDRAFPVKNESGAVYRIVGIAEDITERKRGEHLLQAQRNVAVALSSTSDLRHALDQLLTIALQLEGVDCGGVYLLSQDGGDLRLEAHRGLSDAFVARVSHYAAGSAEARQMKQGGTVYVRQAQISRSPEALWGGEGLRALAVVPIRHQGAVLGTLNLASYRQDELDLKTRVGIELIASQAAGAIARIRAEESSRRNEAHVRTVVNSAPVALLAVDVSGAITFADGQALAAMGLKPGGLIGRRAMEIYADFPLMLENLRRAHAGEEFSSVLEFASTVFECRFTPVGTRSSASADSASSSLSPARSPLAHRHGIIAVAIDVTERFRLQREILEISDREQARIGQDVHDGLCQQLIGATLKANALEQSLTAQQHQQALVAGKLCRLLDEAITESRRVCRGLYPIRLRTEGLVPALEELAANTSERHPLQCRCEAGAAELHCDVTTATHLYRIAQEALNNAVKHSGASRLSLQLAESEGALLLRVSDDGKGLAPGPRRSSSMGLHIMEYRARLIGGSLRIQSDPSGTTVSCRVPLNLR